MRFTSTIEWTRHKDTQDIQNVIQKYNQFVNTYNFTHETRRKTRNKDTKESLQSENVNLQFTKNRKDGNNDTKESLQSENVNLQFTKNRKDGINDTKRSLQSENVKQFTKKNCDEKCKVQRQSVNEKKQNGSHSRKRERRLDRRWRLKGILIPLLILNVTTQVSGAVEDITSRMIASLLGYPSTCTLGPEVHPCMLSVSCWLRGGTRLRGCGGGWLFSCCGSGKVKNDVFENSIPSSEWKYKVVPPKLRQVPKRSVIPTNVFRRRVDDDSTQMDCGLPASKMLQKRIIGGREARFAEFPWQAHVRISAFQCGGVLVSRWYVATAAHCVYLAQIRDISVWLGALDTSTNENLDTARKISIVERIVHPRFQYRMTQPDRYDIALLKLSRPVTYTSHILPICLPDYDLELRGKSGVIAGWGKTDTSRGDTGTNMLRSATVPFISTEQCLKWHKSKHISVELHSEMICAGHSDGHQDACLGDSGGPLIMLEGGRYYLVGIISAGFGCGEDHQPGIYHNVKMTASWIRSVCYNQLH